MRRMPAIDVLRGLAALAVMLFHSLNAFGPQALRPTLHPLLALIRKGTDFGYLGVSIFFAISGWCIAQRVRSAWTKGESGRLFLLERGLRIFPVYWCALLVALLLRLLAISFNHHSFGESVPLGPVAALGDILLIQPYLGTPAFLLVSWSLVFELGFYALACVALSARRRGVPTVWLVAAGFGLAVAACLLPSIGPLLILRYWSDFFAGMVAWQASRLIGAKKWLLAGGGLLALVGLSQGGWNEPHHLTAIATAVLLLLVAHRQMPDTPVARVALSLGAMSYSLYLIHICALSPWNNLAQHYVSPASLSFVGLWLVGLALALALGWGLHHFCEAPIERWRKGLFKAQPPPELPVTGVEMPENLRG